MSTFADTSDAVLLDPVTQAPVVGAHCTVWTADPTTGTGTQITAITAPDGTSLPGYVTSDADGRIPYKTVDDFRNTYLQDPSGNVYRFRSKEAYDTTDDYLDQFPDVSTASAQASTDAATAKTNAATALTQVTAIAPDAGARAVGKGEIIVRANDHGAVGDGTTDDGPAINAQLAAMINTGKTLKLDDDKVYAVKSTLINPGVHLTGGTIKAGASLPRIIDVTGVAIIDRTTINGNGSTTSELVRLNGAAASGSQVQYVKFTDSNVALRGLYALGASEIEIDHNKFDGCTGAITVQGTCSHVSVTYNRITHWSQRGIYVIGDASNHVSDLLISHNRITDLVVGGTSRYPIRVQGYYAAGSPAVYVPHQDVEVSFNYVQGPGFSFTDPGTTTGHIPGTADQISFYSVLGLKIVGNTSLDGGDGGMTIEQQCSDVTVNGNVIKRADTTGLFLGSATSVYVRNVAATGNNVANCGQNRMGDRPVTSCIIANHLSDSSIAGNVLGNDATTVSQIGVNLVSCSNVSLGPDTNAGNLTAMYQLGTGNTKIYQASTTVLAA